MFVILVSFPVPEEGEDDESSGPLHSLPPAKVNPGHHAARVKKVKSSLAWSPQ